EIKNSQEGSPAGGASGNAQSGSGAGAGSGGGGSLLGPGLGAGAGELVKTVAKMLGDAASEVPGGSAVADAVGGVIGAAMGSVGAAPAGLMGGAVGAAMGEMMAGFGQPKITKLEFNDGLSAYSTSPMTFESTVRITLKVGANMVEITPAGVTINGVLVRINS
ncbi:MAG: hypothetical protein ABIO39_03855, partial [Caulobacteraceae bacterium]